MVLNFSILRDSLLNKNGQVLFVPVLACVCYSILVEVCNVLCML